MINRRNIRIKVLQSVYALHAEGVLEVDKKKASRIMDAQFNNSRALFVYQLWVLTQIADYARIDANHRKSKNLPTPEDLATPFRIAECSLNERIKESEIFREGLRKFRTKEWEIPDLVRRAYEKLKASGAYAIYNNLPAADRRSDKEIFLFIYQNLVLENEDITGHFSTVYPNWDDDGEMLADFMAQFLSKPGTFSLADFLTPDKTAFAEELLETTVNKKNYLDEFITPRLKNWDRERLALLDMVMLEMGTAEFLYFTTIPTKVTINEYIDIAKDYSTPQSGQFVNGILDSIKADLEKEGLINKTNYIKQA